MAEHSPLFFQPLLDMLGFTEKPAGPFYMKLDKAEGFVHVMPWYDMLVLTAYTGTLGRMDGFPLHTLIVTEHKGRLNAFDDKVKEVAKAADWKELGLILTRSSDTTYFQMGVLFLLMAGAYKGTDRFRLLHPALQAA